MLFLQANRLLQSGAKQVLLATDDAGIKDCITGAFAVSAVSLVREISKVRHIVQSVIGLQSTMIYSVHGMRVLPNC